MEEAARRKEGPDGRGGKTSLRNSPCVTVLPGAASAGSSTAETVQKGGQRGKTPL